MYSKSEQFKTPYCNADALHVSAVRNYLVRAKEQ